MPTSGLVISDLHLLAKRSLGESLLDGIKPQLERCDVLILNGDTFDFRWSTLRNETDSIAAAIGWLDDRLEMMEGRDLHFIHGNHDCIHGFSKSLEPLQQKWPNLHLHRYLLRLGARIFLHGDCANRKMDQAGLEATRIGWANDKPRGALSAALYDIADLSGLSLAFHRCYFPQETAVTRVAYHLDAALPGWRESTGDCYFGHTHMPFRDHRHAGISFHNTGSGIRGMGFQPIEFEEQEETK
jgi:UDP-2,3-diacylglucosamine hydrolase